MRPLPGLCQQSCVMQFCLVASLPSLSVNVLPLDPAREQSVRTKTKPVVPRLLSGVLMTGPGMQCPVGPQPVPVSWLRTVCGKKRFCVRAWLEFSVLQKGVAVLCSQASRGHA